MGCASSEVRKQAPWDLPGGPGAKTLPSSVGSVPGQGAEIPGASQPENQNIKPKQYHNTFSKDLKK